MSHIPCPHCGFQNFAISAYCGRCERPLQRPQAATAAAPTAAAPLAAELAEPLELPEDEIIYEPDISLDAEPEAQPALVATPRVDPTYIPTPEQPVPAPSPPLSVDALPPTPIEVPVRRAKAPKPRGPVVEGELPDPDAEVVVATPSLLRHTLARFVDLTLVAAVGALYLSLEAWIGDAWLRPHPMGWLASVADWTSLHAEILVRTAIVVLIAGLAYSLTTALRKGQTLGRQLTDSVLVRRSGKPMAWPILVVRLFLSLFSIGLLCAGYLWPIIDKHRRTWHDVLCGTVVVRRRVRPVGR